MKFNKWIYFLILLAIIITLKFYFKRSESSDAELGALESLSILLLVAAIIKMFIKKR